MLTKSLLIGSLSLVLFHIPACADPLVYVVSAGITGNGQFGTVDLSTGAYRQIGPVEPDGYFGLASSLNGSLAAGTYAANLDSINPATGVPTRVGPNGLGPCVVPSPACGQNSFADLGGLGGKIYATDFQNNLYTVNPMTGAATLLNGHTGIPAIPFVPGTMNSDGTLNFYDEAIWGAGGKLYATFDAWVFDPNSFTVVKVAVAPELYQIDPLTGIATVIGDTDLAIGGVTDVNGTSYAFNDMTDQITSINLSSGETTFVSSFDPAAGVIQGAANAAPEPGSVALAVVGLIGLAACGRRKGRS
jgi:PEP-CTERM motif